MENLISIDLKADFGFLRKPDTNDGIAMSYNMLHKPGLLGILGAIIGMEGYMKLGELPEYYQKLSSLKIGIAPQNADNGNFPKTTIVYTNTVGYANKDKNNAPATFVAYENTLVRPAYRVFVALSKSETLYHYLKTGQAEYIPYLGKNEFPVWWDNFQEYKLLPFDYNSDFEVKTLFIKNDVEKTKDHVAGNPGIGFASMFSQISESFFYFEHLPRGFREFNTKRGKEYQYDLAPFVYSNARFKADFKMNNIYALDGGSVVQLN